MSVKESGKKEREILKIMRKNSNINSFYYFHEVLDFNWLGVRMMCWVRVRVRISLFFLWEMLTCVLKAHVKDSINRNFVSEIVLIYYLKI